MFVREKKQRALNVDLRPDGSHAVDLMPIVCHSPLEFQIPYLLPQDH
jgi:hypothetical protein